MTLQELLDDIEDEIAIAGIKVTWDRFMLLGWASNELNKISQQYDADCFHVHLDPAISTVAGTRYYDLPINFGTDFCMNGGDTGDQACCLLDDGTSEAPLNHVSTAQFFSTNLRGESNGRPSKFTVITGANGRKQLALSPPPDDVYSIDGLYKPTDWALATMDSIPALPGNSSILKYAVLHRLDPRWDADYGLAKTNLAMELAKSRRPRFTVKLGDHRNEYTLMR